MPRFTFSFTALLDASWKSCLCFCRSKAHSRQGDDEYFIEFVHKIRKIRFASFAPSART